MPASEMKVESNPYDLRAYVDILVRRWRVVAGVTLACVVVAVGLSLRQETQYSASADLLMGQSSTESVVSDAMDQYAAAFNVARILSNQVEKLVSGTTVDAVSEAYDGPLDPDSVDASIVSSGSDVVRVSATASDAEEVARLVNLYVQVFVDLSQNQRVDALLAAGEEIQSRIDDLTTRIAGVRQPLTEVEQALAARPGDSNLEARRDDLTRSLSPQLTPLETQLSFFQGQLETVRLSAQISQTVGPEVLTAAEVPQDPVAPKPIRNGVLAFVVGLLLGVVAAFIRDTLDERIRTAEDLTRAAGAIPPLSAVPEVRESDRRFIAVRDDGKSAMAEAFRSLRTSVKFAGLEEPLHVIQVTSALAGEGKTTTVVNLAEAFAQSGSRVVVVCCDMRRPRAHESFGLSLSPGLTNVLLQDAPLATALRQVSERLFVLPAGTPPPNPSELLSTSRAATVIAALAAEFDIVLLDTTPVLPVTDALVVSRLVDAVLVVVDVRSTKRTVLTQALERLTQVSAPVIGLVLNGVGANGAYVYGYGYGYGYGDAVEDTSTAAKFPVSATRRA